MGFLLLRRRYYCVNASKRGCHYCLADVPFTPVQMRDYQGHCRGLEPPGCDQPLVEGDPEDLRLPWAAAFLAISLLALGTTQAIRTWVFPPPLDQVSFALAQIHTEDNVGLLQLRVDRGGDVRSRIQVHYAFADGSAKADEDYEPVQNTLTFEPGERSKPIPVKLLPDRTLRKESRYFTLTLLNVLSLPRQTIHIDPREADLREEKLAEDAVRHASATALDVGDEMLRQEETRYILANTKMTPVRAKKYDEELETIRGNLTSARERYLQQLGDLRNYHSAVVMRALDEVHTSLEQSNHEQQAQAVERLRAHFRQLQQTHEMDMDHWAVDLERIIPHASPRLPAPPSATTAAGTST